METLLAFALGAVVGYYLLVIVPRGLIRQKQDLNHYRAIPHWDSGGVRHYECGCERTLGHIEVGWFYRCPVHAKPTS